MRSSKIDVTFTDDRATKEFILDIFDKTTDQEGYLIEKKGSRNRCLTPSGEEIHIDEFAGFIKGSDTIVKGDLPSLLEAIDRLQRLADA